MNNFLRRYKLQILGRNVEKSALKLILILPTPFTFFLDRIWML